MKLSLPGTKVRYRTLDFWEHSFPGTFVPSCESSMELSLQLTKLYFFKYRKFLGTKFQAAKVVDYGLSRSRGNESSMGRLLSRNVRSPELSLHGAKVPCSRDRKSRQLLKVYTMDFSLSGARSLGSEKSRNFAITSPLTLYGLSISS